MTVTVTEETAIVVYPDYTAVVTEQRITVKVDRNIRVTVRL